MTVIITLSELGSDAGPTFDLYASPDGITFTLFAPGINKTVFEEGYEVTVPDGTTDIKVTSVGECTNSEIVTITTPSNPIDCEVSDWSACVNGTQTRSVTTQASGGGTECPALSQSCTVVPQLCKVNFGIISSGSISQGDSGYQMNLTNDRITNITGPATSGGGVFDNKSITLNITPSVTGQQFKVRFYKNGTSIYTSPTYTSTNGTVIYIPVAVEQVYSRIGTGDYFEIYIETLTFFPFNAELTAEALYPTESIDISRYFIVNAFDDEQCTPPPLYYSHPLSMGYLTNSTVCSDNSQAITVFTSNGLISEGDTIYTNPELTDRLIGGRKFYKNLNEEDQYIKVSDGGIVGPIGSCV